MDKTIIGKFSIIAQILVITVILLVTTNGFCQPARGDNFISDFVESDRSVPTLSYWHVWTDDKSISHQTQCELSDFQQQSMGGDAAPQWNDLLLTAEAKIIFAELPVGWIGEWHENPKPQWIIPLSGKWFVETMDGVRVEMGVGEVSFGGDQNTKLDVEGHRGHLSGTVGNEPAKLAIVQLKGERWLRSRPGDFK